MSVKTQNLVRTTLPGWCGLAAFFFSLWIIYHSTESACIKAVIIVGVLFITMFCVEAFLCYRGKFGLIAAPCSRRIDSRRIFFKIAGLIITIACLSSVYWLFPEYHNYFYEPFFQTLAITWPCLAVFFIFCIIWEDPRGNDRQ